MPVAQGRSRSKLDAIGSTSYLFGKVCGDQLCPVRQHANHFPLRVHAATWSMIGSILSSFLPISRLAISTS